MKLGCLYAFVSVALVGLLTAIIIPNFLPPTADAGRIVKLSGTVAIWLVGVPAFIIGFLRSRWRRSASRGHESDDQSSKPTRSARG